MLSVSTTATWSRTAVMHARCDQYVHRVRHMRLVVRLRVAGLLQFGKVFDKGDALAPVSGWADRRSWNVSAQLAKNTRRSSQPSTREGAATCSDSCCARCTRCASRRRRTQTTIWLAHGPSSVSGTPTQTGDPPSRSRSPPSTASAQRWKARRSCSPHRRNTRKPQRTTDVVRSGRLPKQPPTRQGNFELLDARIASALNKIIQNSHLKKKVSLEEQKAQKEDRFLRGRQITFMIYDYYLVTGAHDTVLDYADVFSITLRSDDVREFVRYVMG